MENVITIQDGYIARVAGYNPKGYNFTTLRTKAWKKALAALMLLGFTENQAQEIVLDANGMAELNRSALCATCKEPFVGLATKEELASGICIDCEDYANFGAFCDSLYGAA